MREFHSASEGFNVERSAGLTLPPAS